LTVVIDTSAVAAIIFGEPDAEALLSVLLSSVGDLQISAATLLEVGIVVESRQGAEAFADLGVLLDRLGVVIIPFDHEQMQAAMAAWRRFGRGRHPANLNLGDCFAYALTKVSAASLLYKGNDFTQTDVASALSR
jgi:ribonuclease VapC